LGGIDVDNAIVLVGVDPSHLRAGAQIGGDGTKIARTLKSTAMQSLCSLCRTLPFV
jgi:hypothetical protein